MGITYAVGPGVDFAVRLQPGAAFSRPRWSNRVQRWLFPRGCRIETACTDDFVSAGRISGAKSIPILKIGSFHMVEGKRLQVNSSATRYQRELAYLMSII